MNAVVNENGDVESVKVINGLGAGCEDEVVNVLKATKFVPGTEDGKNHKIGLPSYRSVQN